MCPDHKPAGRPTWLTRVALLSILSIVSVWLLVGPKAADDPAKPAPSPVLPAASAADAAAPAGRLTEVRVRNGHTFEALLMELGLERSDCLAVIERIRPVFNLRRMQIGQTARLYRQDNGEFHLSYEIDLLGTLIVDKSHAKGLQVKMDVKTVTSGWHIIRGRISYSLFDAIAALGERDELADRLASLFEYDVDFNRDLRRDDRFALLVEKRFVLGQFIGYGRIHAAYLINADREITLGWHCLADRSEGYFHPSGDAAEKFFLRCPLPFMRLTSSFGNRRHPVLGFSAQHNGIDLGAPAGTPVRSTASGRIRRVGRDPVRGLFLEASHPNGYETHYYHLQSVAAAAAHAGRSVAQSQTIAFVGNSGRSTGPHLHYGIKKAGRFINPLSLRTPPKRHLPQEELAVFQERLRLHTLLIGLGDPFLQFWLRAESWLSACAPWLATARETAAIRNS